VIGRIRLAIASAPADDADDDAVGQHLVALVGAALGRGGAPPSAVVLRGERLEIAALHPVIEAGQHPHAFLAGLSRSSMEGVPQPVAAVGVIGVFRGNPAERDPGPTAPLATVFLEWPDGRWWHWRALVELEKRELREDTAIVRRAVDGDALPDRMGRWWAFGRRRGLRVHFRVADESMVH
jgi:hypothetical protein